MTRAQLDTLLAAAKSRSLQTKSAAPTTQPVAQPPVRPATQPAARPPVGGRAMSGPGRVYYVNFPDHPVEVVGATGGGGTGVADRAMRWAKKKFNWGGKLPLGHAGVLVADAQGRTRYYDYGRYADGNVGYSSRANGGYFGNVRNVKVPDFNGMTDAQYVERLRRAFPNEKSIEMFGADTDDVARTVSHVTAFANDRNRDPYAVGGNTCGSFARKAFDVGRGWDGAAGTALDFVGGFTPSMNAPSLGTSKVTWTQPGGTTPLAMAR